MKVALSKGGDRGLGVARGSVKKWKVREVQRETQQDQRDQ